MSETETEKTGTMPRPATASSPALRNAPGAAPIAVVANMTPMVRHDYGVPLPADGTWKEVINSDALDYGGSGFGNLGAVTVREGSAILTLPPLATIMLEHVG